MNDYDMIDFLISRKAKMDYKRKHAFLYTAEYCDVEMIRYVASLGARLDGKNEVGGGAYQLVGVWCEDNRIER